MGWRKILLHKIWLKQIFQESNHSIPQIPLVEGARAGVNEEEEAEVVEIEEVEAEESLMVAKIFVKENIFQVKM